MFDAGKLRSVESLSTAEVGRVVGYCEGNVPGHSKRARTCLACRRDYLLYLF